MSELNTIFNHSGKIKNIFTKGKFYNTTLYSYGPTSFVPGAYLKTERNRRITSDFYRYLANRKCKDLISKYEDADNQSEMTSRISSEMDNSSNWNLTEPIREKNNCSIDFTRISDLTKNKEKEKNKKNKADHDSVNDVPPKKKESGYKMMNIDLDREWTTTVCDHAQDCPKIKLKYISSEKLGYNLVDLYKCTCGKTFKKNHPSKLYA